MELEIIDKNINEILDGRKNLPKFNQPEHAGVCSAGPLLIGALIVCDKARESISTSSDAPNGGAKTPSNWEIDVTLFKTTLYLAHENVRIKMEVF